MINKNICKFTDTVFKGLLNVSCFVYETDTSVMLKNVPLTSNRMILVTNGSGYFSFDGEKLFVKSGNLCFGLKGESFEVISPSELNYMYVGFDGDRADELLRRFDIYSKNRLLDGFEGLIPMWSESITSASESTIDLASESILLYTFSRLRVDDQETSGLLKQIIEMTEASFNDPNLSLATLSERLSYNPKYVSHFFKIKIGIGYSEYLRKIRIKFAVSLFDRGIDSVKNVALLSGFTDPLYFSSVFKKQTGQSPQGYIKK